ncbi:MAG: hypothetical protein A2W61_07315 [Deltaproteobacteria bacterium RIFCSPLOWO2_01_44_7]|nr:MAG: hypothetical protein A2712_07970 [Deltaproteobacteria bacterium RIFCSPHIGHO2_01_FULL_43_49]OGQ14725.1 MAG: hypothetical protein A3D22_09030 [Deltaproteobacteria bacterium RIFCSPHIGHO2_02_FULL_44_53]OGQ28111.1 MAG: hypothetical protein A3D98_07740 [Deltaproteobacteria bacterium RIFCSPHIGHO2_12_FULL_44_21]OGQ31323.1 MAG: hypothetical protein A2979_07790 [Deltaproteobacteria bacterium RIFCSPLOWO2_01_FULL_45_74]OGQ40798.1 MAG: hypothetical protein A2W61_07315 [Deltaproteobacteria bacterium 
MTGSQVLITNAVTPLVDALLVGPKEFWHALDTKPDFASNEEDYESLAAVADVFTAGMFTKRILMSFVHISGPYDDHNARVRLDYARGGFANNLENLRSGHYALGRAAIKESLVEKKGKKILDTRLLQLRQPGRPARPVGLTSDAFAQRIRIGSQHEMIVRMAYRRDPEMQDRFRLAHDLGDFGMTPGTSKEEIQTNLERVWRDDRAPAYRRISALELWHETLMTRLTQLSDEINDRSAILEGLRPPAEKLFGQACVESDGELRRTGRRILANLLGFRANPWALSFLKTIEGHLTSDRHDFLIMVGGILALHGNDLIDTMHYTEQIIDGALALLDIAKNNHLPNEIRADAFSYAIYAVEKFVPHGAQILYDWAAWQVETEKDPHMAFEFAYAYSLIFTAFSDSEILPANTQQVGIAARALKRRDLSLEDRKRLWDRLNQNQNLLVRATLGVVRRFGPMADTKAPHTTPAAV